MFRDDISLTSVSELLADTLADYCYYGMYRNCTSLVNAMNSLNFTTNAVQSCVAMFYDCISLVNAPNLPATNLAQGCYASMFQNCTSLVNAPNLPATNLIAQCYNNMFYDCTSLNYIKVNFTNWFAIDIPD